MRLFFFFNLKASITVVIGGSEVKVCACNVGDLGSIPGLGRSPGEGNGNPLQYSCLENPMDGGAWWATVHGVAKSRTRLSDFTSHNCCTYCCAFLLWELSVSVLALGVLTLNLDVEAQEYGQAHHYQKPHNRDSLSSFLDTQIIFVSVKYSKVYKI